MISSRLLNLFSQYYPVLLDGRFLGYIPVKKAVSIERQLRCIKTVVEDTRVPCVAEVHLFFILNPSVFTYHARNLRAHSDSVGSPLTRYEEYPNSISWLVHTH